MRKGTLGIRLAFYGVLAFVLGYLGYSTLLFLLLGVALLVEKDEWTVRQVLQAVVLCFIASIVRSLFNAVDFIGDIPFIGAVWNVVTNIIEAIVELLVLVCAITGIIKNMKEQDADLPLAKNVADWAYGVVKEKAAPAPAAPVQTETVQEEAKAEADAPAAE